MDAARHVADKLAFFVGAHIDEHGSAGAEQRQASLGERPPA
jgi:hypothetical protein